MMNFAQIGIISSVLDSGGETEDTLLDDLDNSILLDDDDNQELLDD